MNGWAFNCVALFGIVVFVCWRIGPRRWPRHADDWRGFVVFAFIACLFLSSLAALIANSLAPSFKWGYRGPFEGWNLVRELGLHVSLLFALLLLVASIGMFVRGDRKRGEWGMSSILVWLIWILIGVPIASV